VMVMFMKPRLDGAATPGPTPKLTRAVVVLSVIAILLLGLVPDNFVGFAKAGVISGTRPVTVAPVGYRRPSR